MPTHLRRHSSLVLAQLISARVPVQTSTQHALNYPVRAGQRAPTRASRVGRRLPANYLQRCLSWPMLGWLRNANRAPVPTQKPTSSITTPLILLENSPFQTIRPRRSSPGTPFVNAEYPIDSSNSLDRPLHTVRHIRLVPLCPSRTRNAPQRTVHKNARRFLPRPLKGSPFRPGSGCKHKLTFENGSNRRLLEA